MIHGLKCVEQKILNVSESGFTIQTRIKEHVANIRQEMKRWPSNPAIQTIGCNMPWWKIQKYRKINGKVVGEFFFYWL